MANDTMTDMTEEEMTESYGYPPFDPFKWNEYYLANLQKGQTMKGAMKHTLTFRDIKTDEAIYHNINYDENGRMLFSSGHNKILTALVQNNEKTIAEALKHAKGNKKITIWLRCDLDGKYMNIKEVRKELSAEDKMNDGLKEAFKQKGKDEEDDLPM